MPTTNNEEFIPEQTEEQAFAAPGEFNLPEAPPPNDVFQIDYYNRKIRVKPNTLVAAERPNFLKLSQDFLLSGVLKADATVTTVDGDPGTEATLNSYTIEKNSISRNMRNVAATSSGKDFRHAGNA